MGWKLNKYYLFLVVIALTQITLLGQFSDSAAIAFDEGFVSNYHYSDSEQVEYKTKPIEKGLDEKYWKLKKKDLNYSEDSVEQKKKDESKQTNKKQSTSKFNFSALKYLWVVIVVILFVVFLYYLWPYLKNRNKTIHTNFEISDHQPDEDELKRGDLKTAFEKAYENNDFRNAFRWQYLELLKLLVLNNLILYKKDRTNGDYLRQLRGQAVYDNFKVLTLAFDEIWYGEIPINRSQFDKLLQVFEASKQSIKKA